MGQGRRRLPGLAVVVVTPPALRVVVDDGGAVVVVLDGSVAGTGLVSGPIGAGTTASAWTAGWAPLAASAEA